jgi:PKD repeat protein
MKAFFTKKIIALLVFCSILITSSAQNYFSVIVSGYVKDANGLALANKPVTIKTDSSASNVSCYFNKTVNTNPNGYYLDTIKCTSTNIPIVKTYTPNCNGTVLTNTHTPVQTTTPYIFRVESNFIVCVSPGTPTNCLSKFTFTISGNVVQFNSHQSTASSATDSIIKRDWSFGDGSNSYLTGNVKEPSYTYANPGTYTVCLKITTAAGCVNTYCVTIVIPPINTNSCKAKFNFVTQGKTASFINTSTPGDPNTYINSSFWKFGVTPTGTYLGSSTLGNPTFTFPANGNYLVCLKITTTNGCLNDTCMNITINDTTPPPPVVCYASFNFNFTSYNSVVFNSLNCYCGAGDSIIKRDWNFGDSLSSTNILTGNIKDPSHTYNASGAYHVCLKITTAKGCTSTFCIPITVNIPPTTVPCKANFNFVVQGKTASFTSTSNSGTSGVALAFLWRFGVNATGGSLATSTLPNPTFTFPANGTYLVCLKVTSANGCVSDTCKTVVIHDTILPPITACKAQFVFSNLSTTQAAGYNIKFNSANSYTATGDSIISRNWSFGDSASTTNFINGNVVDPAHFYATAGVYNVCLKITTAKGCVNTACLNVYVGINTNPSNCTSFFTIQNVGYKEMKYNSSLSFAGANDSIVSRIWSFGDGTTANGNLVTTTKKYNHGGTYSVCLKITTAKGCVNNFCTPVKVIDSATSIVPSTGIKIVNLYPNPTFGNIYLNVRSFVTGNISAQIEVFDVYNNRRILKTVTLANGNNFIQLNSSILPQGVYLIKITSNNGMDATRFIKL